MRHTTIPLQSPPDWQEILTYFRGSELQNYFTKILEDDLKVHVHALPLMCLTTPCHPLQACIKPQYVDQIPKAVKVKHWKVNYQLAQIRFVGAVPLQGTVQVMLDKKDEQNVQDSVCEEFGMYFPVGCCYHEPTDVFPSSADLTKVRDRNIEDLSGGELQRFACAVVCIQRADM